MASLDMETTRGFILKVYNNRVNRVIKKYVKNGSGSMLTLNLLGIRDEINKDHNWFLVCVSKEWWFI